MRNQGDITVPSKKAQDYMEAEGGGKGVTA